MAAALPVEGVPQELVLRIEYSEKYLDENYEYRHVLLPKVREQVVRVGRVSRVQVCAKTTQMRCLGTCRGAVV